MPEKETTAADGYRSTFSEPRAFRSRRANVIAAALLLGGIFLVVVLVAVFS